MKKCSKDYKLFAVYCSENVLLLVGLIGLSSCPTISMDLIMSRGSTKFENCTEPPLPTYLEITMFNWTNSYDVHNTSVKPLLTEMGPYVFRERYERVNVTEYSNGTITFNQIRMWHFMPELSNGSLDDEITNLNVISSTVAYIVRDESLLVRIGANALLNLRGGSLFVTKRVGEWLFDGYYDPVLDFLREAEDPMFPLPFDKFGWFVERNGSWSYDGEFNMNTGVEDLTKKGTLHLWNGRSDTGFYSGGCSQINGTTGRLWPPNLNGEKDLTVFLTDICRSITLKPENFTQQPNSTQCDVQPTKWIGDERVFDNGENYPPNTCFCTGRECPDLKSGVFNISDCQFGYPAFLSYPHFYLSDPSYSDAVDGLNATKEKHEFSILLDANSGVPLEINARLKMNILLQPISGFTLYANVPHVMVPMFWFTQRAKEEEEEGNNVVRNIDDCGKKNIGSRGQSSLLNVKKTLFFIIAFTYCYTY